MVNVDIFFDALGVIAFREWDVFMLQSPADENLGLCSIVLLSKFRDGGIV